MRTRLVRDDSCAAAVRRRADAAADTAEECGGRRCGGRPHAPTDVRMSLTLSNRKICYICKMPSHRTSARGAIEQPPNWVIRLHVELRKARCVGPAARSLRQPQR
ncbi:hypothetical protein EVAR_46965_1 [Eumeta japonica]|uniref:Uncharacterized protein n=1 Tax=Eumeta variegata TaxID=151549 RepID=A0A4C1YNX8_EUMVA|nr:hypothetical protein EVAR_46965_1 [Eumeta japonica]